MGRREGEVDESRDREGNNFLVNPSSARRQMLGGVEGREWMRAFMGA